MQTTLQPCMAGLTQQHKWYGCLSLNFQAHRNVVQCDVHCMHQHSRHCMACQNSLYDDVIPADK